jgi:hypothetical protein
MLSSAATLGFFLAIGSVSNVMFCHGFDLLNRITAGHSQRLRPNTIPSFAISKFQQQAVSNANHEQCIVDGYEGRSPAADEETMGGRKEEGERQIIIKAGNRPNFVDCCSAFIGIAIASSVGYYVVNEHHLLSGMNIMISIP